MENKIILEEEVNYEVPFKFVAAGIIILSLFLVGVLVFIK